MARPKKNMSFDGMVKLFLQYYRIPTRKDIEKLMDRIDQLEKLIKNKWSEAGRFKGKGGASKALSSDAGSDNVTASDIVIQIIADSGSEGVSFAEIKDRTGFADKKLRNIIFRLNKMEKIRRVSRGIYAA